MFIGGLKGVTGWLTTMSYMRCSPSRLKRSPQILGGAIHLAWSCS